MNAVSLLKTIEPKSDQLNSDDLIGRSITIKVVKVSLLGEADQPVAVHYEGDNGKPFKPCKSMRRVLVQVWGSDGNAFIGQGMTLYRDEKVQFGGLAVGGIRISHMSGIDKPMTMALTATRTSRKPFTVQPLKPWPPEGGKTSARTTTPSIPETPPDDLDSGPGVDDEHLAYASRLLAEIETAGTDASLYSTAAELKEMVQGELNSERMQALFAAHPTKPDEIRAATKAKMAKMGRS